MFLLTVFSLVVLSGSNALAQEHSVPITFHRQEHALSCEIAALKMALSTHRITVSEDTLISQLAKDPTPKGPGIWGNPSRGFVGDIDGTMLVTGYGVYADPIAAVGNMYAQTSVLQGSSVSRIAQYITKGSPVIVWGHYGSLRQYSWKTPDGTLIQAINGEHARVVYGFDGPVDNPTTFYLQDPLYGVIRWSRQEFENNWNSLNRMGVVVHHPRWVRIPGETKVWEISRDGTTRRWVTTWAALVQRAGKNPYIMPIDSQRLAQYSQGPHIE